MKKVMLVAFALILVVAGLVSAAAFEGHVVDVRAHVENALWVDPIEINYGNFTFPQESIDRYICIGLTESFVNVNQTRVCDVKYALIWETKPIEGHDPVPGQLEICDPTGSGNFTDIYPYILLTTGDGSDNQTPFPMWVPANAVAWGTLDKCLPDNCDTWGLKFDVPVFDLWYNEGTDPATPSGVLGPDEYCIVEEWVGCDQCPYRWVKVPHADLGNNLKIQVMGYSYD